MNVGRFQIALNHEDPEVVTKGLEDFRIQILHEHHAVELFGYNGRSADVNTEKLLRPHLKFPIVGLLASFIQSSPQVEELFIIWGLPGREGDKKLCAAHMSCIAAILHCTHADERLSNSIVSRILHEHSKSIYLQISSGDQTLIHSTLGLLIAIGRTSHSNARDMHQRIMFSAPSFVSLVQRGKSSSWVCPTNSESFSTDSRLLLIILFLTILDSSDDELLTQLLLPDSLFRRIFASVHKDHKHSIQLALEGLSITQKNSYFLSVNASTILLDSNLLFKLFTLYDNSDDEVQSLIHTFLVNYSTIVAKVLCMRKGVMQTSHQFSNVRNAVSHLAKYLEGHRDLRHREVTYICEIISFLKFIYSIPTLDPNGLIECTALPTIKNHSWYYCILEFCT